MTDNYKETINKAKELLSNMTQMDTARMQSPVHVLNLDNNNLHVIAGMWLISQDNYKDIINENIVKENVIDTSILIIDNRTLYEIEGVLYGCLKPALKASLGDNDDETLDAFLSLSPLIISGITYKALKEQMDYIILLWVDNHELKERYKYVLYNIWFLTYAAVDKFINNALEEFQNNSDKE